MKLLPYIFVLLAAMLWGLVGTTQTFLQEDVSAVAIACVRSAIGGGVLLVVLMALRKIDFRTWSWRWTLLAALAIGLFQLCFFSSVRYTGVALGTVVTIGSSPVFAGLLEWLVLRRKPSRTWVMATLCAIVGCILLFVDRGEAIADPLGIALALTAGLMFALYANASKQLMAREATLPAVAMTFTLCALLLLPLALSSGFSWLTVPQNIAPILFMALASTTLAYILFLSGLQKISSSSAVTLSLAEPLTAALLGVLFVGEYLSPAAWCGVLLLLGGIVIVTLGTKKVAA